VVVSIPPGTELLASQIQAMLRASQDEDLEGVDEEVVEDLLSVLSGSGSSGGSGADGLGVDVDGQVGMILEDEGDGDEGDSDDMGDILCSARGKGGSRSSLQGKLLNNLFREPLNNNNEFSDPPLPSSWQKHEVKAMLRLLKERGE
jgi:hypothetical protein